MHGVDNRVNITTTASYPWRVHASLLITAADNSMWIGTGWFIGPHTLMTAGHVVYIKNSGVPGRDGWVKKIHGHAGTQRRVAPVWIRHQFELPLGHRLDQQRRSELRLRCDHPADQYRQYGRLVRLRRLFRCRLCWPASGNISGYPGDKPTGTQWYDSHKIAIVNTRKVYYDIDTSGGQSGSAVYRIIGQRSLRHSHSRLRRRTTNSGTRIVKPVFDNMVAWKA